jgi:hypothetical protein
MGDISLEVKLPGRKVGQLSESSVDIKNGVTPSLPIYHQELALQLRTGRALF